MSWRLIVFALLFSVVVMVAAKGCEHAKACEGDCHSGASRHAHRVMGAHDSRGRTGAGTWHQASALQCSPDSTCQRHDLQALILNELTVYRGRVTVYARHLRLHPVGAEQRALDVLGMIRRAAHALDVDPDLMLALALEESALNAQAVNPETGAAGFMQLNPRGRYGRAWARDCRAQPAQCEARNAYWGAVALRDGLEACEGHEGEAIGWYRTKGRCVEGPRARMVLRRAGQIRVWRAPRDDPCEGTSC